MSSSDEERSVLSSASMIMARHRKKKWKKKIFGGITGKFSKSSKLKNYRPVSQSVGSLVETATSTVVGNLHAFSGSWGNLDSISVASNTSDESCSVDSHDSRDSYDRLSVHDSYDRLGVPDNYDRLSVPVQFSDSGILQSSQESLLSNDSHTEHSEVGIDCSNVRNIGRISIALFVNFNSKTMK